MTVKEHYNTHLGDFYAWMTGDMNERIHEHEVIFQKLGISVNGKQIALDLGCGHGIQTLALAQLGFEVKAVDFNKQLLHQLEARKSTLPVQVFESDILAFLQQWQEQVSLITCMGDTLTHFDSAKDVAKFFQLSAAKLQRGGKILVSFRDLTNELMETDRFIPVKADDNRILTCFLEYHPDKVMVYDVLWEKSEDGWKQKVSGYPKLRLSQENVKKSISTAGLAMVSEFVTKGMNFILAEKLQASTH